MTALLPTAIDLTQRGGFMLAMLLAAPFILGGFLFQLLSGMISKAMPALPVVSSARRVRFAGDASGWRC